MRIMRVIFIFIATNEAVGPMAAVIKTRCPKNPWDVGVMGCQVANLFGGRSGHVLEGLVFS